MSRNYMQPAMTIETKLTYLQNEIQQLEGYVSGVKKSQSRKT